MAPHFDEVIIVDRAAFGDAAAPRMSAPQTYHLHVLLKGGEQTMEALAPGFLARLEAAGFGRVIQWFQGFNFISLVAFR